MHKLLEIMNLSKEYLEKKGIESAKLNAELIIAEILKIKRLDIYLNYERPMIDEEIVKIREWIKRRGDKEPLQYILGKEEFYGLTFRVNKAVLIPRQDTEILVEKAVEKLKNREKPKVLDIGVGSGAISISIAYNVTDSVVLGVDISDDAICVARENMELNEIKNLKLIKSNIFENINYNEFDMIISNPPYIPDYEYETLMREVKEHEPKMALVADDNGYFFYKKIINEGKNYLVSGGVILFEVGYNQAQKIGELFRLDGNYKDIEIFKDYAKIERVVTAVKK
jgi:release factor glutamine methyltransferase